MSKFQVSLFSRDRTLATSGPTPAQKDRRSSRRWPGSAADAIQTQRVLAPRVETLDRLNPLRFIGGADVAFENGGDITRAAIIVMTFPALDLVTSSVALLPTEFPYVPGLLSFREVPALAEAYGRLEAQPDLLLVDGHGYAHPRRFGVACHLGIQLDLPTIGVGKSRLTGRFEEPGREKGAREPLIDSDEKKDEEVIGSVLRTRRDVKPVFVSIGHRVSLATAVETVLACASRYRLPEPIRLADRLSKGRQV